MKFLYLSMVLIGLTAQVALAQDDQPVSTQAIYACAEISNDAERLACYDETVGRFEAAEAAGEVATISKSEVEELKKDSFGFALPSIPRIVMPKFGNGEKKEIEAVTLGVQEIARLPRKNLRITLDNGQIWEQTDTRRVPYSKAKGVETAEIKRASLGSFKMKLDGGVSFRVKRIR